MEESLMIFLGILFLALSIWVDYLVAKEFYLAANLKGYSEKKYFWICFFLGIAGYLLVIALPSRISVQSTGNDELPDL